MRQRESRQAAVDCLDAFARRLTRGAAPIVGRLVRFPLRVPPAQLGRSGCAGCVMQGFVGLNGRKTATFAGRLLGMSGRKLTLILATAYTANRPQAAHSRL